jgi:acyl-CoA thioesterase
VALQCSISFHAAAKLGERLTAECQERSRTNRTGVYDIEVTGEGGRAIAFFRGVPYRLSGPTIAF